MQLQIFAPTVTHPMKQADRLIERFLTSGRLTEGVEPRAIDASLAQTFRESYERAWSECGWEDNAASDLDSRAGQIHTQEGRFESFQQYSGDRAVGRTSTLHVNHRHDGSGIESVDRRELRAGPSGFDYVAVKVDEDGNVDALATHIDRASGQGTEQSWYLRP